MQHNTTAFYNKLAPVYPFINFFLRSHRSILIDRVNSYPSGKLLEIGIGNGSHLPLYSTHKITGIDISDAMLKRARRHKGDAIQLLQMNGESLEFDNGIFDYVVLSHVVAVTADPGKMLDEIHRVLRPGGKLFILNHFTPDNALRYVDKLFDPISRWFHFRSLFHLHDLATLKKFLLVDQENIGKLSYFKIIVLQKP